jgi:hypothetical protein
MTAKRKDAIADHINDSSTLGMAFWMIEDGRPIRRRGRPLLPSQTLVNLNAFDQFGSKNQKIGTQ